MNVLFLVLDGLPVRRVGRRLTPALAGLAAGGGWAPMGGVATMPSCTYPNHATFVTGTAPDSHGIHANHVVVDGRVRAAADVAPRGPTLFDACRDGGRSTLAVLGDHNLVAV
ncbi:alkaline phosphatase family protein [Pseudonocardia sp.]|uniref:alkaline phosphatase family protein n=1 Tax=Pseudonocardia sp. TaxID=60912 RepID=UPI002620C4E3|nr:alkaline phosphatase family protein [Pseudonocardia sp.]MCW2718146.1 Phosphodiesterase [Pseudonocardia sp.]